MNRRELSMAAAITVVLVLIAGGVGVLIGSHLAASPTTRPLKPKPLYWVSPMAPSYRRNKPGKDPMGMRLVPVYASQKAGKVSSDVRISPWVIDNIGVRVAPVRVGTMSRRIRTVGYVSYDDNRLTTIASRVGGWIRALQVNSVGDRVAKGDLLYELFSPQLVAAQSEYLADQRSGLPRLIAAARQRLRALGVDEFVKISGACAVVRLRRLERELRQGHKMALVKRKRGPSLLHRGEAPFQSIQEVCTRDDEISLTLAQLGVRFLRFALMPPTYGDVEAEADVRLHRGW